MKLTSRETQRWRPRRLRSDLHPRRAPHAATVAALHADLTGSGGPSDPVDIDGRPVAGTERDDGGPTDAVDAYAAELSDFWGLAPSPTSDRRVA